MVWFPPIFCNEIFNEFRLYIAGNAARNEQGQDEVIGLRIVLIVYFFNIGIDEISPDIVIGLLSPFILNRNI